MEKKKNRSSNGWWGLRWTKFGDQVGGENGIGRSTPEDQEDRI